jgi:hypothetical protein
MLKWAVHIITTAVLNGKVSVGCGEFGIRRAIPSEVLKCCVSGGVLPVAQHVITVPPLYRSGHLLSLVSRLLRAKIFSFAESFIADLL